MLPESPSELKSEVAKAFDAGQYQRVVDFGRSLQDEFEHDMEAEDWYRYGQALRKTEHVGEALEVSRRLYRHNSDIPQVRSLYAWCIYDIAVGIEREKIAANEARFRRGVEAVLELTGDQYAHSFSPRTRAVFRMIDYLEEERQNSGEEVLTWVQRLNPDELSDQIGYWRPDDSAEVVELPSDREKWYSAYTKALFDLERYQDCLDACEDALRRIPQFSSTNEVWIKRRHALCNGALGYRDTAIEELREVLEVESRWFIYYELARLARADDNIDRALHFSAAGALCGEVDPFRWKLFRFMAVIADQKKEEELARQHAELALALREQAEWSMGASHKQLAARYDVDLDKLPRPDQLVDELRPWWEEMKSLMSKV